MVMFRDHCVFTYKLRVYHVLLGRIATIIISITLSTHTSVFSCSKPFTYKIIKITFSEIIIISPSMTRLSPLRVFKTTYRNTLKRFLCFTSITHNLKVFVESFTFNGTVYNSFKIMYTNV